MPNYRASGFEVFERGVLPPAEWPQLETSWAKRLKGKDMRSVFYIRARAVEFENEIRDS